MTLSRPRLGFWLIVATIVMAPSAADGLRAQEQSVRPGINDSFKDAKVQEFVEKFEIESREVYAKREQVLKTMNLTKGQTVADIGAGTGLYTRMFSDAVGSEGHVLAVDITKSFLDHIEQSARETNRKNIQTVLCTADSTNLMPGTVDVAFICDTYHHFEFPLKTMKSLHAALKPCGRVFLIDFKRVEGESSDWTMKHVRAGQEVFEKEVTSCGFRRAQSHELLKENYFLEFVKAD